MLRKKTEKILNGVFKKLQKEERIFLPDVQIEVEFPKEKMHGDLSTNVALLLSRKLKKNPQKLAQLIVEKIDPKRTKWIEKIEVKDPGFINFFLSKEFLLANLREILRKKENYGKNKRKKKKTIIIDYSSPNIAKRFGIGHLRSTIIGQALYNIFKFLGHKVIGDNHIGDWGTQFGKLIYQIKKENLDPQKLTVEEMEKLYVKFHQEAEKNPKIEEEGRKWFKKLEEGDKEARRIWQACVKKSLKEFEKIYQILGIKIDYTLGESFYEKMIPKIIEEAKKKKLVKESRGALIMEFSQKNLPPAILLKSDRASTYFTRDLATIKYRVKRWKPDLIIYEVGADQKLHFQQLFTAAELFGWIKKEKLVHVAHGLYRLKEGKFSTRKGLTVHLEDVLKEAIERAKEIIEKSKTARKLTEKEKEKIAKMVGIGAVKYNDLKQHPSKDIIFEWEKILNLKGNSAPYLQYTFARCKSVLGKAKSFKFQKPSKLEEIEIEILKHLAKFQDIVEIAGEKFSPNLICDYLFELAQKFNRFYDFYPILKAEIKSQKNFRLSLTFGVSQILEIGSKILGISLPEKM